METDIVIDVWFHRYENGRDIEGRFDYNSWQESDTGRKLVKKLDKDVVLAEGMLSLYPSCICAGALAHTGFAQATKNTKPTAPTWR